MPHQTEKAINRIQYLEKFIRGRGKIDAEVCYAELQYHFGVSTRTTAAYLQTLSKLGIITVNGQLISWVEK